MAKSKSTNNNKVTFGKRKGGKARKSYGPKDQKPKPYKGQGK
jgi:hypothetical protein